MFSIGRPSEYARQQAEAIDRILTAVDYDSPAALEHAADRLRAMAERLAEAEDYPTRLLDELREAEADLRATAREAAVREFDFDSVFTEEERAALDALAARQMSDLGERRRQMLRIGTRLGRDAAKGDQ